MAPEHADAVAKEFVSAIRESLERGAALAKAAEACAAAGSIDKAVEIANEIDDLTHEAAELIAAIILLERRLRTPTGERLR